MRGVKGEEDGRVVRERRQRGAGPRTAMMRVVIKRKDIGFGWRISDAI